MGSAQNVQFHLSSDERMVFAAPPRPLIHRYEDAGEVHASLGCYALEEVLAEKLRAVGGQRRHAIARGVYDIAQLVRRGTDTSAALDAVPVKAAAKGVDLSDASVAFRRREEEYRASWDRTLEYLVVGPMSFDEAFSDTAALLERLTV
jgi:predicted nucleotidyltransferase component of viral defense system